MAAGPRFFVNPCCIRTYVKKKCKIVLLGKSRNSILGGHMGNGKRLPQQPYYTVKTEVKKTFPQRPKIELSACRVWTYDFHLTAQV